MKMRFVKHPLKQDKSIEGVYYSERELILIKKDLRFFDKIITIFHELGHHSIYKLPFSKRTKHYLNLYWEYLLILSCYDIRDVRFSINWINGWYKGAIREGYYLE